MQIKNYDSFINESEDWSPHFGNQGERISKKEDVTKEELDQLAAYFTNVYKMTGVFVGRIKQNDFPYDHEEAYGVIGTKNFLTSELVSRNAVFRYYFGALDEIGWISSVDGRFETFMSPLEFFVCVQNYEVREEMYPLPRRNHFDSMLKQMEKLALQSPRRGKVMGKKYGL